ncbi:MAG: cation:proton antiporter, partial [bacterium]
LASLGLVGSIYMLARVFGKVAGTWLSSIALRFPWDYGFYLGIGLVPQAGVALGMAMIVNSVFPDKGSYVLTTVIATTVIYELFGPILTRVAIKKSGELP